MIDEWTIINRREIGECTDDAFSLHHPSCADWLSGPTCYMPGRYFPPVDPERPYVFKINDFVSYGGDTRLRKLIKATFPNAVIDDHWAMFTKDDLAIIKLASTRLRRR